MRVKTLTPSHARLLAGVVQCRAILREVRLDGMNLEQQAAIGRAAAVLTASVKNRTAKRRIPLCETLPWNVERAR